MIYLYSFINSKVPLTAFVMALVMIFSLTLSNQKWKVICLLALKKWLRKNWPMPGWQLCYDPTHSWPNYEAMQFLKVIKIRYLDTRSTGHLLNHTASFAQNSFQFDQIFGCCYWKYLQFLTVIQDSWSGLLIQKWSFCEKKKFFGLNYQNLW